MRDDGITLLWGPPINPNGRLLYYSIQWLKFNETNAYNCSINENSFKVKYLNLFLYLYFKKLNKIFFLQFPNTTIGERLNITIRAVGNAGIGIPIYINLAGLDPINGYGYGDSFQQETPILGI